jgi:hypothetical protein
MTTFTRNGYGLGVETIPGRKARAVVLTGPGYIDPIAYIRNERDAEQFEKTLEALLKPLIASRDSVRQVP